MERKAALANLTCSKRQEAAPAAGRATVEVRPDLNSFQISATTLAKVVRARSEATHATATWRMPLPCPPAHLVLASLLLIFFGHAARASISPPGAVAHMHAVESAGYPDAWESGPADRIFRNAFPDCRDPIDVPPEVVALTTRTVTFDKHEDQVLVADMPQADGSQRELHYGGVLALPAAAPNKAISDVVFAKDVDFRAPEVSRKEALVAPVGRHIAVGTACTNTIIDGGHRFDLWSISKDTSLLVYNAHFVNNMAPYYPFMAGTNKPYVNGKVLYVNVRFSEVCKRIEDHQGLLNFAVLFKGVNKGGVEGLDNLGTGVKSYTVLDWGVQRSSFVAIRYVNVTFGCVPSVGPGSPARELGPPVLDMAYRRQVRDMALQWQGTLEVPWAPGEGVTDEAEERPGREVLLRFIASVLAAGPLGLLAFALCAIAAGETFRRALRWLQRRGALPAVADVVLEAYISSGTHGAVYRGTWKGQEVAVKIFGELVTGPQARAIVARAALPPDPASRDGPMVEAWLHHPNLVRAHTCLARPAKGQGPVLTAASVVDATNHWDNNTGAAPDGKAAEGLGMGSDGSGGSGSGSGAAGSLRKRSTSSTVVAEAGSGATAAGSSREEPAGSGVGSAGVGDGAGMYEVWVVMEHCDLGDVEDALQEGYWHYGRSPKTLTEPAAHVDVRRVVEVLLDTSRGLQHLHSNKVVHGDVEAKNVLLAGAPVDKGFLAKVADFSVSRVLSPDLTSTTADKIGTISHLPPEVLFASRLSPAADVYALAHLASHLVEGKAPHAELTLQQVMKLKDPNVATPLAAPPGCPAPLAALIAKCTATDPKARPGIEAVIADLESMLASDA